uniref:P/Homo B domain-containing protein n=1 Tax=Esox lucius TaxID=8010 RepID=A0A6Q2XNU5_ESOLU
MCLLFIFILSTLEICQSLAPRNVYTNHWAVRIAGGQEEANKLAAKYGYDNYGQIGSLEDHYHFHHSRVVRRAAFSTRGAHSFIHMDPKVDWVQQQLVKPRIKRYIKSYTRSPDSNFVHFNDPKWSNMWYIHCTDKNNRCRSEMNILAAWQRGYTGKNVVVTILDDGIERNHPDLAQNYDQLASYDVNGNDHDPTPRYDSSNENKHGTRCAGEVAAVANNSHCIVGIAYNARIGGIRMLDGDVTDVVEAKSLGIRPDYIDIYSASWGPDDDGKTVDGPGPLAKQAFEMGIKKGRKGLGSIFVWASGNGGRQGDHCSCDGYTNSIYTISISSTTENGNKPWYLEVCSSTLATTYSSGEFYDRKIVTTDLRQRCTDGHTGTSVSAPMVAGVIALALEANPLIGWRDVQHLLVKTSRPVHLKANDWKTNAAGHRVSHLYGFGLVDADGMVVEAKKWRNVPAQHTCSRMSERRTRYIRPDQTLNSTISSTGCAERTDQHVGYLEHVVVRVLIAHPRRGDLEVNLISPSGTRSQLLAKRLLDNSNEGFRNWEFMSVHCWGEKAVGQWTLELIDSPSSLRNPEVLGKLKEWTLVLYGTSEHPYQTQGTQHSRSRMLEIPSPSLEAPRPECGDQGCDGPDADHCLNCIHYSLGNLKTGRTCVSHCPLGFYDDTGARRCRRCHKGCEKCVGRTPTQCRSCRRGLYFNPLNATCSETCPAGYFTDDSKLGGLEFVQIYISGFIPFQKKSKKEGFEKGTEGLNLRDPCKLNASMGWYTVHYRPCSPHSKHSSYGYDHKALFWSRHSKLQCARICESCQEVVGHIVNRLFCVIGAVKASFWQLNHAAKFCSCIVVLCSFEQPHHIFPDQHVFLLRLPVGFSLYPEQFFLLFLVYLTLAWFQEIPKCSTS